MIAKTCLLLEDLVRGVQGQRYPIVEDLVRKRIELTLLKSPRGRWFTDAEKQLLAVGYYTGIQLYRDVQPRTIDGAPYFRHVDEAYQQLLVAGVRDPITLLVDIFHDVIEEKIEREKKQRERQGKGLTPEEEAALIVFYTEELQETLTKNFHDYLYHQQTLAQNNAGAIVRPTRLLTRGSDELYYRAIEHPFTDPNILAEELRMPITERDCVRAIIGKYGDRLANMNDMESRKEKPLDTEIARFLLPERIHRAFKTRNYDLIAILEDAARLAADEHPPRQQNEFTGSQRLYQCFKSVVLTTRYRVRKVEEKKPIFEVGKLHLSRVTAEQARIVGVHVCRYHSNTSQLNPRRVFEIMEEHYAYARAGGYEKITRSPGDTYTTGFDGMFEGLFNARLHGNKDALRYIDEDRSVMFRVALAMEYVAKKSHRIPDWYIRGISAKGLQLGEPIKRG